MIVKAKLTTLIRIPGVTRPGTSLQEHDENLELFSLTSGVRDSYEVGGSGELILQKGLNVFDVLAPGTWTRLRVEEK